MADSRPKCLVGFICPKFCSWYLQYGMKRKPLFDFLQVIDEIDGALGDGKGAVEVILKMVLGSTIDVLLFYEVYYGQQLFNLVI